VLVLVDQAAQDRFSADLPRAGICCDDTGTGISAGDALADALMGPGAVVMLLIPGQDSAQVRLVHLTWATIQA
jgi:ABC-type sugar transport system substrate-binding protein